MGGADRETNGAAMRLRTIGVIVTLALGLLAAPASAAPEKKHKRLPGRIMRVFEGDTFQIEGGLRSTLLGVSTPPFTERGGKESFEFLRRLLTGKRVYLEVDAELLDASRQAQYYIFLEDGVFVNALILLRGFGRAVVKHPNVRYRARLLRAETTARKNRIGIWGDAFPDPQNPHNVRPGPPVIPRSRQLWRYRRRR